MSDFIIALIVAVYKLYVIRPQKVSPSLLHIGRYGTKAIPSRTHRYNLFAFLPLHLEHSVCKFDGIVFPPLDTGMI